MHWIALWLPPELAAPGRSREEARPVAATSSGTHGAPVAEGADLADPLTALGWWALQFTPKVVLSGGAVLLEVSTSTRLWGGQAALLRHICESNKPVVLVYYGQGDTSLVALARAQHPPQPPLMPDQLPLSSLAAAQPHLATLARLGCRRWGQLRALPRAGVARRFGAALVDALDQAYGLRPDVYPWLSLPEVFEAALELPQPVDSALALLFGARRLLAQLQVWLQLRQRGVLAVELGWLMDVRRNTATQGALVLRSAEASADTSHLLRLLAERLGQLTLPAPVLSLRLRSLETQALQGQSASLLLEDQAQGDSLAQLLERLSARLGVHNVLCLLPQADHRPEQMQRWRPAAGGVSAAIMGQHRAPRKTSEKIVISPCGTGAGGQNSSNMADKRAPVPTGWATALYPTWLLAEPLPLRVVQQQPHYQGPLTLLAGPQRLEAAWWAVLRPTGPSAERPDPGPQPQVAGEAPPPSGPVVLRDYFVARSPSSPLLWIYRERLSSAAPAWFLHGVFG